MTHPSRGTRLRLALAAAVLALPAGAALAEERPVVVGPLLDMFEFGAGLGVPLGCNIVGGYVVDGADEVGAAAQGAQVADQVNQGCVTGSEQGLVLIEQGKELSGPLSAVNAPADAGLEATATVVEQSGEDYAGVLAPFGPTVQGSGGTVRWFQGG